MLIMLIHISHHLDFLVLLNEIQYKLYRKTKLDSPLDSIHPLLQLTPAHPWLLNPLSVISIPPVLYAPPPLQNMFPNIKGIFLYTMLLSILVNEFTSNSTLSVLLLVH